MEHIAVVNTSIEAAMLLILHTVDPKPQDIVLQYLAHLLLQRLSARMAGNMENSAQIILLTASASVMVMTV